MEIFFPFFFFCFWLYIANMRASMKWLFLGFFSTGVIPGIAYHSLKQAVLPAFDLGLYE